MNRKPLFPDRYALIIRPMEPMQVGQRHVAVLTKDLTDDTGVPFTSPDAFMVLRDDIPVTNEIIEEVRPHYEDIFAFLEGHGYARDNLLLAWDFMVASQEYLLGSVLSMREEVLDEVGGIPTTVALFGSTAHLPQPLQPQRQVFRFACTPHDDVVSVPVAPMLWRGLCSSACRSLNSA